MIIQIPEEHFRKISELVYTKYGFYENYVRNVASDAWKGTFYIELTSEFDFFIEFCKEEKIPYVIIKETFQLFWP